jgi:hypothetical protein
MISIVNKSFYAKKKCKCNQIDCYKVFKFALSFSEHTNNHLCDFVIFNEKNLNTNCGESFI